MNSVSTIASPGELSEKQKTALLNLLTDEDPEVYRAVRETILAQGPDVTGWLRRHALSDDPVLRRRAKSIILHFERITADNAFLGFCLSQGEDLPLEEGALLLAKTRYPEVNEAAYRAVLDSFVRGIRPELSGLIGAKKILGALNNQMFGELGFTGNEQDYYDPENSYLNRVIDRRTGNPISLCVLYILIAKRLQLPIAGIGLPGHFICRYQSSAAELYVDVFNRGRVLTKADCIQYLLKGSFSVREEFLSPVSSRRILLRMCGNLHQICLHRGDSAEATRFQRYMVALAK